MATLDDSVLDNLRELNVLRNRAKDLRERGRKALTRIPESFTPNDYERVANSCDLSNSEWVSGPHPIDVALLVRVLNHRDLGDYEFEFPSQLSEALAATVTKSFEQDRSEDQVPILTAARTMHALVRRPQTVFSTATMLCYYRIVRELYLAAFPSWIIGAARAGEGGRVSAFVTGECVRAILAFRDAMRHTITFFQTTKKLSAEFERLNVIPDVDAHLKLASNNSLSHWRRCLAVECERVVLDWYAANDLRHNVIALDLSADSNKPKSRNQGFSKRIKKSINDTLDRSPHPSLFPLSGSGKIDIDGVDRALTELPELLKTAIARACKNIAEAKRLIGEFRAREEKASPDSIAVTASSHELALRVINEAFTEAEKAAVDINHCKSKAALPALFDTFIKQYVNIDHRIRRIIEPAKRYIQDVLNRELAQAANSAKFDAGELLFAAACFGALTGWKENEQLVEARRLLTVQLPEDGRLQTTRPFQSTPQGLRLIPIAFEMTRCFAQLLQKDSIDLDPKVVRKILNAFEEGPIGLLPDKNETIGWNFRGAPESQKPSVWVTCIAVFALDRTVRMLNERINTMVLRHFNVEWPNADPESDVGLAHTSTSKLDLNGLMYSDYELQSSFKQSKRYNKEYEEDPARVDCISVAIRLQQMRAHLTGALLPDFYTKKSFDARYKKAYSAIFYGPPGTGKTTLAEALANTAKVPMVRLSPSDLMVQGTDVIESRARAIFDSLSMLTQAVIFLDEFEPVVRTRRDLGRTRKDVPPDPP
jgi:SpoVK/Ycf46/Vps4 family AAA+-type ATPase